MLRYSAKDIGNRIKKGRDARAMSASALAKAVDVTPTAVWNWEKNEVIPRPEMLATVARVLGVSRDYLLSGTDDHDSVMPPNNNTVDLRQVPLEDLIQAISARGLDVSVRPKTG